MLSRGATWRRLHLKVTWTTEDIGFGVYLGYALGDLGFWIQVGAAHFDAWLTAH